uniref:Anterior gradient 2, protein disulphide isomerase family member n=1 Tax=Sus scrofa TaxID=9823 RepID=A0A8W4FA10_PIG
MEKISLSAFLLLVALSYTLAKDTTVKPGAKKDTKDSQPKLPQTLSRGWGDQLIWTQTYEEALYKSKTSNKPLMIIHHLDECPHSQALKKAFAENKEIQKLAEQFVLLNLVYETTDKHLSPDGQYVPRILFVDPSLTVRADITGRYSNRLYAYEPSDTALLLDNMKKREKQNLQAPPSVLGLKTWNHRSSEKTVEKALVNILISLRFHVTTAIF